MWNPSQWSDPKLDVKIDEMYRTPDEEKRVEMIREITREIVDKAPYIWLPTPYVFSAWWPWVKNYAGELARRRGAARPDLRPHLGRSGNEEEDGPLSGRRGDDAPRCLRSKT